MMTKSPQRKSDCSPEGDAARQLPARAIAALRGLLTAELPLYGKYLEVLDQERKATVDQNLTVIQKFQDQRAVLTERMNDARAKRDAWRMQWLPDFTGTLREWAAASLPQSELVTIKPLLEQVHDEAAAVIGANREYRIFLDFSLNLVSGCLSLLWSATHDVVRSYSRQGTVQEAANQRASRLPSQCREA